MKWHKVSSKTLLTHPRLTVVEDVVRLPSGTETDYIHFSESHDAAMVLARDSRGKFLVQKEYSYPPNEVLYQLPGGAIEVGETPESGALRELAEEASLTGKLTELGWFYTNNRRSSQKLYVYLATELSAATADKDPEELFEDYWFTASQIEELIRTNEIRNYTLLAGWAMYKAHCSSH